MSQGNWLGQWAGQWFGSLEALPPGFISAAAQITVTANGPLTAIGILSGASDVIVSADAEVTAIGHMQGGASLSLSVLGELTSGTGVTPDVRASWFAFNPVSASIFLSWAQFQPMAADVRMSWAAFKAYEEVLVEWDTAQGVARNLANNLKWEPIHDAEARFSQSSCKSGVRALSASGNGYARMSSSAATLGVSGLSASARANGFVSFSGVGTRSGVTVTAMGNGFVAFGRVAAGVLGARGVVATGGGAVKFVRSGGVAGNSALTARGVLNPTDAELFVIASNVLTHKQKYDSIARTLRRVA